MHRSEGPLRILGPLTGQGVDKLEKPSQRLVLHWGIWFPEEAEVTCSAPENRANLDATIFLSVIEEVGQSSDTPKRAVTSSPDQKRRKLYYPYCKTKKSFRDDDKLAQHLSFVHMFD